MTQAPRERYFPGPQIWRLAQDAYLAGESANAIAARLGLTVNGIRKRAARKGWTRTQHAEALKRSEHPTRALTALLARIGPLIHGGRMAEVETLVQTAQALARAIRAIPPPPPPTGADRAAQAAWREQETRRLELEIGRHAETMARALLSDRGHDIADAWAPSAWHWRANTLGPEQARTDFWRAVEGGWASHYWDEHGTLRPIPEPQGASGRMHGQHQWLCTGKRAG